MKKYFILAVLVITTGLLSAQSETTKRQVKQKVRIEKGVQSGEITKKEKVKLKQQQQNIKNTKKAAKADGVVTKKEKAIIDRKQDKASKNISRKKNNKKSRN
jgi:hypothetical protein